jgi:hypothetical protein
VQADIPDSGVINACYRTSSGGLRVIDESTGEACKPSETSLSWNHQGLRGATGPTGPPGLPGPGATSGTATVSLGQSTTLVTLRPNA